METSYTVGNRCPPKYMHNLNQNSCLFNQQLGLSHVICLAMGQARFQSLQADTLDQHLGLGL